jgi:hypothetical protein
LWLPWPLQSKKFWPTPSLCVVWQPVPQHAGVAHSQPSVFGAVPELQSLRPLLQLYVHVLPLQLGCPVLVLQACLQAPQFEVELSGVSQPFVSGLVVLSQSAQPPWQPVYVHDEPDEPDEHAAPLLCVVSHDWPHLPQFEAVVIWVSHPLVSGGVVLQSA